MRRAVIPIAVGVIALAAAAGWYAYDTLGPEETASRLTLYGNVDIREVDMAFRVSGRVASLAFEEGDQVEAGAVLAKLDDGPYRHDADAAAAAVAALEANLLKLEHGNRPEDIAKARAALAEQKATLANALRLLKRRRELRASGNASQQSYDDARAAAQEAQARVNSAEKDLELMLAGPRVEDIEQAKADLDRGRAELAGAKTRLADTVLLAPEGGTVLTRIVEPGAMVAAGAPVYTLSLRNPVRVRAFIDETQLGRIRPGMKAEVSTDSFPGKVYPAQVGFISPTAEFTPKSVETPDLRSDLVYRVRLIVQDPENQLRQGMPVTVRFPAAAAPGS